MESEPRQQRPPADRHRLDWALVLLGGALLALAIVWMTGLLISSRPVPSPLPMALPAQTTPAAAAPATLRDEAFGVVLPARALRRIVQVLQWREIASVALMPDDEPVFDEGDYQLIWSERMIDASRFAQPQGHDNPPPPPYRSVGLGPAELLDVDANPVAGWEDVAPSRVVLPDNLAAVFRAQGRWLVTTPEHELPQAGDLRVRFEVINPDRAIAADAAQGVPEEVEVADEDVVAMALAWIARLSAFILATLGAGLMLQAGARLGSGQHPVARLPGAGVLALSAWAAVAAVFIAILVSRLL